MIRKTYPTILEAWKGAYLGMLRDEDGYIDMYQRNIVHSFGNVLTANSGEFDFDLGEIGLTITKWTKFTNMYVDPELLHAWINNAMNVRHYDAMMPFKITPPQFFGKKAVHQWGPCILGVSFRRQPKPSTLTFYTRAQSLGFSGVADYALLHFISKKLAERMGVTQDKIRVRIYCSNFIIKMVESVHTLTRWGLLDEFVNGDATSPRMRDSIKYYIDYMSNDAPELKWRAANRMRTKWRNAEAGNFTSLPTDRLTIRGYDAVTRTGTRKSLRAAQELVLGRHQTKRSSIRRPSGLIIPDGAGEVSPVAATATGDQ